MKTQVLKNLCPKNCSKLKKSEIFGNQCIYLKDVLHQGCENYRNVGNMLLSGSQYHHSTKKGIKSFRHKNVRFSLKNGTKSFIFGIKLDF